MELMLQLGAGMMEHSAALIREWGGGTVILSPRDLNNRQLLQFSRQILGLGGMTLFDPQFYLPHSEHRRLRSHSYWPSDYESMIFWSGAELVDLLTNILQLNMNFGC